MLRAMLAKLDALPLDPDDVLVFLGDYIDRGEDSRAVIETLLEVREQRPSTLFLRGNHEQLLLDARSDDPPEWGIPGETILFGEKTQLWLQNGGMDALLSYAPFDPMHWWKAIPDSHWEFFRATDREYITERVHFVHAGLLPPGKTWEGEDWGLDYRLWIREPFLSSRHNFGRLVVFGHTPQMRGRPLVQRNKIGIDTAAVFGGPLTAAIFDPDFVSRRPLVPRFLQVENARADVL